MTAPTITASQFSWPNTSKLNALPPFRVTGGRLPFTQRIRARNPSTALSRAHSSRIRSHERLGIIVFTVAVKTRLTRTSAPQQV